MNTKKFTCSKDRLTMIISAVLSFCFGSIALFQLYILAFEPQENMLFSAAMLTLFLGVLFLSWAYAPQHYLVTKDEVIIKRFLKNYRISMEEISKARILSDKETKNTWRTFGNGGLFGVYGRFRNGRIGDMLYFAQRLKRLVMIELKNGKKIVLSPDERAEFVSEVNSKK